MIDAWPWWLGGLVLVVALGWVAWQRRDRLGASALVVGVLAAALLVPPSEEASGLPASLAEVAKGAPCEVGAMAWQEGTLRLPATCGGAATEVVVGPATGDRRVAQTKRHSVMYRGGAGGAETQALIRHVAEAVRRAEADGYTVASVVQRPSRLARWQTADEVTRAKLRISAGLVVATLWVLLALLLPLLRGLQAAPRALLAPLGIAALATLLAPATMRMVYGGYDLTTHLVDGVIPRYGPGALWFYGPPQWLLGADHAWVQGLNRLYGLGSLGAVVALAGRWWPGREGVRVSTAWLVATLPVLMAAYSCESIHAGPALGLLASIWLFSQAEVRHPVAATLPWLAAAVARPEMAVMAALAPALIWALRGRPSLSLRGAWALPTLGAGVMLAVVLDDVLGTTGELASRAAVELGPGLIGKAINAATVESILALPTVAPTVLFGLVVAALVDKGTRRTSAAVVAFAVVWMAVTGVDHAVVSLPRIQLMPLLLCLPVAGAVVVSLRAASRPLVWLLLLLYLGGAFYTTTTLWAPTNEDHEEALWRDAVAALPDGAVCVAAIGYGDQPEAGASPRHNPGYLLTTGDPNRELRHLGHLDPLLRECKGPVYALLGTRCHVTMRPRGAPAPADGELEACRRVRSGYALEPVVERDVVNRGDLAYPMYPASPTMTIGLYTVRSAP